MSLNNFYHIYIYISWYIYISFYKNVFYDIKSLLNWIPLNKIIFKNFIITLPLLLSDQKILTNILSSNFNSILLTHYVSTFHPPLVFYVLFSLLKSTLNFCPWLLFPVESWSLVTFSCCLSPAYFLLH